MNKFILFTESYFKTEFIICLRITGHSGRDIDDRVWSRYDDGARGCDWFNGFNKYVQIMSFSLKRRPQIFCALKVQICLPKELKLR